MSHSNDSILCCHAEIQRLKLRIKALTEENDELKKGVTLTLRKTQVMQRMLQVERQCYNIEQDNKYLRSRLVEVNNRDTELREQVFELMNDQIRMDWLLGKAYVIQLQEGGMITSRQAIDEAIEEEMREKEAGNHV